MSWIDQSIMTKRGVAGGKTGQRHELTVEKQGDYHYVYGAFVDPVLTIDPGDVVVVETQDAFFGALKTVDDKPSEKLNLPFANPQNGPIYVKGAVKGDVIAVRIHDIEPRGPQPVGTTMIAPNFGGLVATNNTAMLHDPLPERVMKMNVTRDGVQFNDKIRLPYEPFLGTLGVSPQIEAVSSVQPDYWGGNMDLPDMAPGAIAYFPVHHEGGYVYLGDCHAIQGDGELAGAAVEIPATVTIEIDLIKNWKIAWPRLENEDFIMAIGSTRPMEDAARIAYVELITWMVEDYGFEKLEAYLLCTQAGKVRLGNMFDPKYTMGASIKKSIIS